MKTKEHDLKIHLLLTFQTWHYDKMGFGYDKYLGWIFTPAFTEDHEPFL